MIQLKERFHGSASVLAIGLLSETSRDGVGVAVIDTDADVIARFGPNAYRPCTRAKPHQ